MRTVMTRPLSILALLLLAGTGIAFADSTPPSLVNYQGVLRDGTGDPENGSFEMVFRFFDAGMAGSEILLDEHCAVAGPAVCVAEKGAVTVTSGLFSAQLGGGNVMDGAGAGVYGSLAEAFRDFSEVWVQIEIFEPGGGAFQVLSPRVRALSAAYSLNADHLDGQSASFFLDSSASAQVKSGPLTLRNALTVDDVPGAPTAVLTENGIDRSDPGIVSFNIQNSGAGTAQLLIDGSLAWHSANDGPGSGLDADTVDGISSAGFLNTSASSQTKAGNLTVADLTVAGNDLTFNNPGSLISSTATSTLLYAGDTSTDDLFLRANAGSSLDGSISINGDGALQLIAGDGTFFFYDGATGIPRTQIDAAGNVQMDGDLTVSGDTINLANPGATLQGTATNLTVSGGDVSTDDLILRAATSQQDGAILIQGDGAIQLVAGNGTFQFFNAGVQTGSLNNLGDLQFDRNLLLSAEALISVAGTAPNLTIDGSSLQLHLGGSSADHVFVPGDLTVSGVKNFVQNHPYRRDLSILYTALEGDEPGTYTRGSARLMGGEARVPLGETFAWVTSPELGLTAHVTPRGGWSDLYVASVTPGELVVRSRDGSDADFDYVVYGLRIGYEDYPVVQRRKLESKLPAEGFWSALYEAQPDLAPFSPRARFQKMRGEEAKAEDRAAARALRQGIG
ncbi:MAG TPA: hypothetical protein VFO11_13800, partial [Candidatus Polarisedimenticolaceae bacterium]|nr:hypothetical protein [Candidatus Polarisedimenticolaceae bacterium]